MFTNYDAVAHPIKGSSCCVHSSYGCVQNVYIMKPKTLLNPFGSGRWYRLRIFSVGQLRI